MLDLDTPMAETAEQADLRVMLRRFLASENAPQDVRRLMTEQSGFDPGVWRRLSGELGLAALSVPEANGGAGFGVAEQIIVMEELGRSLYGGPFLASAIMACDALLLSGDVASCKELLPDLASGESIATLAYTGEGRSWWPAAELPLSATQVDGAWQIEGTASYVLHGCSADLVIAVAETAHGASMFAVHSADVVAENLPTLDQTRKLARLSFAGSRARPVGELGDARRVLTSVLDRAVVALGAEQIGAAERCLEMSVEYAKIRDQFGTPIGRFQAIKHLCADMYLAIEAGRSAVMFGARALDEGSVDGPAVSSLIGAWCAETFFRCAADTLQIHGGIGFTWESDVHLFLKRAEADLLMFGGPDEHREALVRRLGR